MTHRHPIRVRYADTDAMGVAYNGAYLTWFEVGRTEWLRARGIPYRTVEERGAGLPVVEASLRLRSPARYDDLLDIRTRIHEVRSRSVRFGYEIFRSEHLLAAGWTDHVPVDPGSGKGIRLPAWLIPYLDEPVS